MKIALVLLRRVLFSCVHNTVVLAIFVPTLLCGALFAPPLTSQETRSIANTWTVTIVLPPRLMAGHPATLGVLGVDGKLAAGVQVDLGNGLQVTTDRNGRALFTVPVSGDYLLTRASGASAVALIDPASGASEPKSVSLPSVVSVRDRFWICGAGLSGDADANNVRINGKAAVVLAASPVCVVVLAELNSETGPAAILVQAPGVQWTAATTLVSLEFAPPRPALQPGQKGQIEVRVDGTSQKLRLVVEDRSPGVLRFEGGDARGDARRLITSGGPTNIAGIKVQAIASGDYSLRARLVPTPDPRTAERFLAAAESLAPEDSRHRVSELASRLARKPSDFENVEVAVDKIATQTMTGDFRTLLDAARGVF